MKSESLSKYRKEVWIEALIEVAIQVICINSNSVEVLTYALVRLLLIVEVLIEELVEVRNENISRNINRSINADTYKSTNLESVRVNGGSPKSQVAVWLYFRQRWKFSRKKPRITVLLPVQNVYQLLVPLN